MALQEMYNNHVKVDEVVQKRHSAVIDKIITNVILKIRNKDPFLDVLFTDIYYTGSRWDGLQVGTDRQECDINMCFRLKQDVQVVFDPCGRGDYQKKPNFGFLKFALAQEPSSEMKDICKYNDNLCAWTVSPGELFKRLQSAGDAALADGQVLDVPGTDGERSMFRVTRKVTSPWTLHVEPEDASYKIVDIDIVPAIRLPFTCLNDVKLMENLRKVNKRVSDPPTECMAISMFDKDQERFKIDFHETERGLLKNKGCVKTVIRLMKYLRNVTGGPFELIPSHLIKTCVMHVVLENRESFWNDTLEECFKKCMLKLGQGISATSVSDIFFENDNMVISKIKGEVIKQIDNRFVDIIKKLEVNDFASLFNFDKKWMFESYLVEVKTDGETYAKMNETMPGYILRKSDLANCRSGIIAMLHILADHLYSTVRLNRQFKDLTSQQIQKTVEDFVVIKGNWTASCEKHESKAITLGVPLNDSQKKIVLLSFDFNDKHI